jgi:hypothetical protein
MKELTHYFIILSNVVAMCCEFAYIRGFTFSWFGKKLYFRGYMEIRRLSAIFITYVYGD